jgi:DNA-directed RNA polymerase I, II, and III subunit RPABC3
MAKAETVDMELTLDVNTEIYPLNPAEKFTLLLASALSNDPTLDKEAWRPGRRTLADDYDYVMNGKVYKFEDSGSSKR